MCTRIVYILYNVCKQEAAIFFVQKTVAKPSIQVPVTLIRSNQGSTCVRTSYFCFQFFASHYHWVLRNNFCPRQAPPVSMQLLLLYAVIGLFYMHNKQKKKKRLDNNYTEEKTLLHLLEYLFIVPPSSSIFAPYLLKHSCKSCSANTYFCRTSQPT
uniref:Uncharacterized protein n=1 Tax=Sipha flava TaxID=143950 RepID=A0A2S2QR82_9HEMI